jgi:sugar/nucleoside kinase (ribokinase family)
MSIQYGVIGAFTIDNIITHNGDVHLHQCGGNAFYAAAGARLWSDKVGVVARIGEDYPRARVKELEAAGVDIAGVHAIPGPHLMQGGILYDGQGAAAAFVPREYFASRGQAVPAGMPPEFPDRNPDTRDKAQLTFAPEPEDVPERYLTADSFHLPPRYYVKHQRSLAFLKQHGIQVFLDPGAWYMREKDEEKISVLFRNVDVLLPSEFEVRAFFGQADLAGVAVKLASFGPRIVVVKIGSQGSLVYDRDHDKFYQVPVYPATVVDPTGAGDSYCGGFMVGYTETQDPLVAAMYGTISSSFVIEGFGAQYSLQFDRARAEERLEMLKDLYRKQFSA